MAAKSSEDFDGAGDAIFGGKNFDAQQGWGKRNLLAGRIGADQADVRNANPSGRDLGSLLRHRDNVPELFLAHEPGKNECLNTIVVEFAHVTFLNMIVDKVAVRPVSGLKVIFER